MKQQTEMELLSSLSNFNIKREIRTFKLDLIGIIGREGC